jgi:hypothetical protein
LKVLSRNAVPNAKSGKTRVSSTKGPIPKAECLHGAKIAIGHLWESATRKRGRAWKHIIDMRSAIELLTVWNKSDAEGARAGRLRVIFIKTAATKADWRCGARNVNGRADESVTRKRGRIWNNIIGMRSAIELLTGWNKNDVADAKGGRLRVISTKEGCVKTACSTGAKHVQIKLPTKHIRNE